MLLLLYLLLLFFHGLQQIWNWTLLLLWFCIICDGIFVCACVNSRMNLVVDYTCYDHLCCTIILRAWLGWSSSWVKCSIPARRDIWLSSRWLRKAKRLINYKQCVKGCCFLYCSLYLIFCHISFLCSERAKKILFGLIVCTQRWTLTPQVRGNRRFVLLCG